MTTEAGKRLEGFLHSVHLCGEELNHSDIPRIRADIAAIEAEAVAARNAEIAHELEFLTVADASDRERPQWYWDGWHAAIAAVLAIIEKP